MREEAIIKAVEFGMHFWQSTLFLIRKVHFGIDHFGVNFASMKGNNVVDPNDGSVAALAGEVDDDEGNDSEALENANGALDTNLMVTTLSTDLPPL